MPADKFDVWHGIGGQPKYEHTDEQGNYKHLTQIMGEQSIEFLRGCSDDQPFCLSVSFKAPHVQDGDPRQFIYDPVYKDLYKDAVIPVPKTADPRYFESFPEFFRNDNEARRRWEIRFSTPEKYQESVKGYYRLITGVDVVTGRIRDELERLGLADNTVVMLLGDNGFYLGEHGIAGKWYGHEESIRVPLVIYDPRLPEDRRGQELEEIQTDRRGSRKRKASCSLSAQIQSMRSPVRTGSPIGDVPPSGFGERPGGEEPGVDWLGRSVLEKTHAADAPLNAFRGHGGASSR